jgi:RNA ligase
MFELDATGNPVALVALPPPKFFNNEENPLTMGLDFSNPRQIMLKMDGSLINTYMMSCGKLRLKSKASLASDQAVAAMSLLETTPDFKAELEQLVCQGYTVSMEFISPTNRIVVGYATPDLVVLAVRNHNDGSFVYKDDDLLANYPTIVNKWVNHVETTNPVQFVQSIKDVEGIEGYVIQLRTGQFVKCKSMWYMSLHHAKDSINNPVACSKQSSTRASMISVRCSPMTSSQ